MARSWRLLPPWTKLPACCPVSNTAVDSGNMSWPSAPLVTEISQHHTDLARVIGRYQRNDVPVGWDQFFGRVVGQAADSSSSRNPWSAVITNRRTPASRSRRHAARSFWSTRSNTASPAPFSRLVDLPTVDHNQAGPDNRLFDACDLAVEDLVKRQPGAGRATDAVVHRPFTSVGIEDAERTGGKAENRPLVQGRSEPPRSATGASTFIPTSVTVGNSARRARRCGVVAGVSDIAR